MTQNNTPPASIKPGQIFVVGNKVMGMCKDCGKIVRLDGWFGGLHICVEKP
jgi:hypothetical protein